MKTKDFEALLKSIDEARAIQAGKRKPSRVIIFKPSAGKTTWKKIWGRKSESSSLS